MDIKTILWPTDLSRNSLKAARQVVSLADKYQAKVIVLYVGTDLTSLYEGYGQPGQEHLRHFQEWEIKKAKEHLEGICEKDLKACPLLNIKLVQGDPATEILKAVDQEKADLIVLTSHGKGQEALDYKTPEFGSVARKVLAQAPVPVVVVNPLTAS
jgi:nucleotide-binding universal stress UspA family protein